MAIATYKPTNSGTHASGRHKTICTSAVLAEFGIGYDKFHYAESPETMNNILRRNGFSVRSRNTV